MSNAYLADIMHLSYQCVSVQFACGGFDLADRPRSIDDVRTFVSSLNGLDHAPSFLYDIFDALLEMEEAGWDLDARYSDVRIRKSRSCYLHITPPLSSLHFNISYDLSPFFSVQQFAGYVLVDSLRLEFLLAECGVILRVCSRVAPSSTSDNSIILLSFLLIYPRRAVPFAMHSLPSFLTYFPENMAADVDSRKQCLFSHFLALRPFFLRFPLPLFSAERVRTC